VEWCIRQDLNLQPFDPKSLLSGAAGKSWCDGGVMEITIEIPDFGWPVATTVLNRLNDAKNIDSPPPEPKIVGKGSRNTPMAHFCLGAVWGWLVVLVGRPARKPSSWVAIATGTVVFLAALATQGEGTFHNLFWPSIAGLGAGVVAHFLFLKLLLRHKPQP
jgi:hypothetical protein